MSVHDASMHGSAGARPRTRPIRVALVDDHQFIADMLRRALERQGEKFEFVGNAPRLADVGALLRRDPADVVLVDYSLPDGRGSDVLRLVRRQWPRARLVLFTGHAESDILHEAIAAGADGVLTKDMGVDHILEVIERAHRGDVHGCARDMNWLVFELRRSRDALQRILARCQDEEPGNTLASEVKFVANEVLELYETRR